MPRYGYVTCCGFQLCNVFRSHAMEIDQCLLDSLSPSQRQHLLKRLRSDQVRAYYEREKSSPARCRGQSEKKAAPKVRFHARDVLQDAVVRHDHKEVQRLLKDGADLNTAVPSGGSLLHLCARHDNTVVTELLINMGLNVDAQDEELWTALHVACACDSPETVLLLLAAGADLWLRDINGKVALDYATEGTETSYVLLKYLEEKGVDVNALWHPKKHRISDALSDVHQIVAAGENVHQSSGEGVTVTGIANQLLWQGTNPTPLDCDKEKPSDIAVLGCIADTLRRAEGCWEHRQETPSPSADTRCETLVPAMLTLNRKLYNLTFPIAKRDTLQEKGTMFPDQSVTRSASRPCAMISPLGMSVNKLEQVTLMPPAPSDDLASLSELTDSSLLYEMQKRFGNDQIYTYIGHILLLVNPNKELPIYSTLVSQLYLSPSGRPSPSLPPHIFSSAERAFHTMLDERRPQCFVLSGESGSGKTVACQHIVQHLIARSGPVSLALDSRMQHANCVLEAFGHARTEMNNNSSRFIKFLSLQYSEKTLMSVKLYVYLLEKSRLVSPPPYQRNFNIFYLMAEGMSSEEKSSLCLTDVLAHRYLHQTGAGDAAAAGATHSTDKLLELKQALHALGFSDPEVENLFRILSAVLHVGDLAFASRSDAETVFVTDPCLLDQVSAMLQVSPQDLGSALTSDVKYLKGDAVAARHTVETANSYRDLLATALYSRIFSFLASCLGDYLQGQEGDSRSPDLEIGLLDIFGFEEFKKNGFEQENCHVLMWRKNPESFVSSPKPDSKRISEDDGALLPSPEIQKKLCVNMTNERIHQCIAEMLFKEEHLDCQQEGVAMETSYTLRDQSPALNFFFQEPDGLLSVLDLESRAPQPEEQHAFQKLQAHHISVGAGTVVTSAKDGNGNPPLENQGPIFSIRHYAGKTTYDLSGSVEKNKDSVPRSILFVMTSSENVLVRQLFRRKRARAGPLLPPRRCLEPGQTRISPARAVESKYRDISKLLKKGGSSSSSLLQRLERRGPVTLAVQMRSSLSEIADRLKSCTPHFIQCIKPNGSKRPDSFDSLHVSAQLQHVGVLEMVKMTRYGYPVRLPFVGFLTRFRDLAAAAPRSDGPCSAEEKCRHVLQQIKLQTGWQMGYNKVFLGYWQANQLDEHCHQLRRKIVICQKVVRGWLVRTRARPRARVRRREAGKVPGFLQATEDPGQPAHDGPVIQAAPGPLPRESGSLRKTTRSPAGKQEEAHARDPNKKVGDDGAERSRVLKNFCSSPVPLPPSVENLVHSAAGLSIKAPTQQTEGGGGGGSGLSSPRKQPPPKPKRDPNTRLSTSIDAVSASLSVCPQNTLADALSKPRPHSDDYSAVKKVPPPKPIRSPNTKLTGSFEEISVPRASEAMLSKTAQGPGASIDGPHCLYRSPEEESVYIEMAGHPRVTCVPKADALEPGEAVYEEMKYPKSDAGAGEAKVLQTASETSSPPPSAETNQVAPEQGSRGAQTYCKGGPSDVPSPFPNLLPHRPPLLAFPLPTVPYSSALDESPLTPLEVKKLPVLETNLNYSGQAEGGARQRSDSSSTPASIQDRLTPPVSPALGLPSPAKLPPPYKTHCHTPFSWETSVLVVTRGASGANSTKGCQKAFQGSSEAPPATGRPPFSPVKKSHPDSRQPHSCCSSPLLFNPSNARPLSSPLDELSTLISAGRSLLKKSTNGRRTRESGFNSNINHPGRLDSGTTSPSPRLQDKNANNHPIGSPISVENGNQLSNVLLEDEDQSNIITSLHRHLDRHPNQRDHLNFSPFGTEATL